MHLQDTSHSLFLIFCGIQYIRTGIHGTGIYAEERKLSYKRIGHNLKCQRGERLLIGRMSLHFVPLQVGALDGSDVRRGGHILQDSVQELLNALVAVCRATAYGNRRTLAGGLAQGLLHVLHGRLLALQVLHGQVIVQLADLLHQLRTVQFRIVLHVAQVIGHGDVIALVVIVDIGFHLEQIDDPLEFVLFADGQLDDDGILAKSRLDLLYGSVEVRAQNVHLVDERHTGHIVSVSLPPYVFGLGLNAAFCAENADCAVQHTKGTLHLHGEVNVSGSINDIDTMLQGIRHRLGFLLQCPMAGRSR